MDTIALPFGMLMMALYDFCENYGVAVILFAVIVNVILLPFQMKAKRGAMRQARLQPKLAELKKKHGANQQKYNQEMASLYKEEGVSMTGGCLWTFLPLPIMLALYRAITFPLTIMMRLPATLLAEDGAITLKLAELGFDSVGRGYYQQIAQAQFISGHFGEFSGIAGAETLRQINYSFLGIDLGATPQWKFWEFDWSSPDKWVPMLLLFLVPVVTTGITVIQTLITQKMSPTPIAEGQAASSSKMMLMMMPAMMLFFGFAAPAALGIYWSAGAVLNILRDIWLTKRYNRLMDEEDETRSAARAAKEAELERKRRETERLRAENKTALNPSTSKKKRELAERKERESKTAEWEKKRSPAKETAEDPARVGTRRYARGRAYDPYRYDGGSESGGEESEEPDDLEVSEYAEDPEDFDDTEASEYEEDQ